MRSLLVYNPDTPTSVIRVRFSVLALPDVNLGNPELCGVHAMVVRRVRERRTQPGLEETCGLLVRDSALRYGLLDGETAHNMRNLVQLLWTHLNVAEDALCSASRRSAPSTVAAGAGRGHLVHRRR